MCEYLDGFLQLAKMLKSFVAVDRTEDCNVHLQVIQDFLPIFREIVRFITFNILLGISKKWEK